MSWVHELFATELGYVVLLFGLFVVPKILERWKLPAAITSLALGALAGMGFGLFGADRTVALLSVFGIVALFLFAGLEVDLDELRVGARVIVQHLVLRTLLLALFSFGAARALGLDLRAAVLVALALLTPSTGFILSSLPRFGLGKEELFWIKSKAIATELLALGVLFVVLQSTTASRLGLSVLALLALVVALPVLFRLFAARIAPYAPHSEFAFLIMLATVFAFATRELGVYYLVGAFLVGVVARRFQISIPQLASDENLRAIELFASFFIPFYFFHAGVSLHTDDFSVPAVVLGALFLATAFPAAVLTVIAHRRAVTSESRERSQRIALSMAPTLVFTLVLAEILRDRFAIPAAVFGGLMVYTVANTLVPGLLLGTPLPSFEAPHRRVPDAPVDVWGRPDDADAAAAPVDEPPRLKAGD